MKSDLWGVILIVAILMGFLMGYSLPPMYEVGLIGNKNQQAVGLKSEINQEMQKYYQELSKDQD